MGQFVIEWKIDVDHPDLITPEQAAHFVWNTYFATHAMEHPDGSSPMELTERTHNVFSVTGKESGATAVIDLKAVYDEADEQELKTFTWQDTDSGRTQIISLKAILNEGDDYGFIGGSLHEWAKEAEKGDEWQSADEYYICL